MSGPCDVGLVRSARNIEHHRRVGDNLSWGGWSFHAAQQAMEILGISTAELTDEDLADAGRLGQRRCHWAAEELATELRLYREATGAGPRGTVGHYIVGGPNTLKCLQEMGVKWDTSLMTQQGCETVNGVCHPFMPFDADGKCSLEIVELPCCYTEWMQWSLGYGGLMPPLSVSGITEPFKRDIDGQLFTRVVKKGSTYYLSSQVACGLRAPDQELAIQARRRMASHVSGEMAAGGQHRGALPHRARHGYGSSDGGHVAHL